MTRPPVHTAPPLSPPIPPAARRRRPVVPWVLAVAIAAVGAIAAIASAAPALADPPDPLPWQRQYVVEEHVDPYELTLEVAVLCQQTDQDPLLDNNVPGRPKIAVLGDSVQSQTRNPTYWDSQYRWRHVTHCGENYGTALESGRVDQALAMQPDVVVMGTGSNNYGTWFRPDASKMAQFETNVETFLQRTSGVRCRVLFNVLDRTPDDASPQDAILWHQLHNQANQMFNALRDRPGVIVLDWNAMVQARPELSYDDQHLTRYGINARVNAVLAASRHCSAPDSPAGVHATAGNGMASVSWTPLPAEEGVTSYRVSASTGQTVTTNQATVNVPGLANGTPVQFSVVAVNGAGESAASPSTSPVVPSPSGSRFHPLAPRRVLDTRDGTGKASAFWPGETATVSVAGALPPEAANASAVVLNVTATGQTANTFVTVFPGSDSRPLTSNLNPRPGIAAVPAMATTRLGPDRTVQLFNNSGFVHLIADVVGWYDQPGSGTGSLYNPITPQRVLDSRDGTGGKTGPFHAHDTHHLSLAALPAGATAAIVNVTATNTTQPGHVTLFPTGDPQPLASNLNPQPGLTRANLTAVKLGTNRSIDVYNNTDATDLLVDLVGYYGSSGSEYFPIGPERHYDTRDATGGLSGPVTNAGDTTLTFAGRGALPGNAAAIAAVDANVTVVDPATDGHSSAWPSGPRPNTSILNFLAHEVVPNRDLLGLSNGTAKLWSTPATIHYLVDVTGWFGPAIGAPGIATVPTTTTSSPTPAPTSTSTSTAAPAPTATTGAPVAPTAPATSPPGSSTSSTTPPIRPPRPAPPTPASTPAPTTEPPRRAAVPTR